MLGHMKRCWWRYAAAVFLLSGLWFHHKSRQVNQQWEQQVEESESERMKFAEQVREKVAGIRQGPGRVEESIELARGLITMQTEQYTRQREAISRARELYDERHDADINCHLLTVVGLLIIEFGLWRAVLRWKQKYLALRAARSREIDADGEESRPSE